jgi:metal-responsive CopG/Arc/MetJ family transcriptional regulator
VSDLPENERVETFTVGFPRSLIGRIETYAKQRGHSRSKAIRDLVEGRLDKIDHDRKARSK